ncbi:hypothetical protein [Lentzea sp. E54]|uniref:hypothetical protein n=1 Tax=Lentzea xerophila TaxID=3435883 RepID=UPI003DA2B3C0
MTGVRRRGYFAAVVAVMGAALIAALFAVPPDKPVDIRLVAPPPAPPEVVTATATTTVSAVGAVVHTPPPAPPPPPPAATAPLPTQKPPPPSPGKPSKPWPPNLFDLLRCDSELFGKALERCLELPLDADELCDFLEEHDLRPAGPQDRGGRGRDPFDVDCD